MDYTSYGKNLKNISRQLRMGTTDAERLLWSKIRKKQIKNYQFFRQKPNGGQHYEDANIESDRKRDEFLRSLDLKVMRFTNLDVLKNIDSVVNKIYEEIEK
ncbi:MAG: hypothetical protein A2174_00330 [Candidatus Portnoybacteria bacterium RBG_13_41_18]|uniref:DUF559 domain-containing protein n=1 Tax=Candidatus Portnoybacteria bacterium RBG_13_41_18 TaxID=1801991 RepID=A0A1G2FA77_9BACT|nr:MAG: hypothetical protein A2174_00330 [Candidatus Portnoybacteria bacterium RBG_13_41_18]